MAQDWDIRPRAEACAGCKQPFQDQQACLSSLVFGEAGYTREDYCETCWPTRAGTSAAYSVWRSVFRVPPPEPEEPLKKETAESLLRRLIEQEDDRHRNVIYILAVMLERKRVLVEKDVQTREDGVMIRVYEHRKTADTFLIPDPRLRLDELDTVQQEVITMLGGGTEEAKPEESAAPPPADGGPAA